MRFSHILFPTDLTPGSRALNKQVEWLAARFGARVTLLHVFQMPVAWYGEVSYVSMDWVNGMRDAAEKSLREYEINVPEDRLTRKLVEGDVAGEIVSLVEHEKVDLIVMGTHSYGALDGLLLGSETVKVLHSAGCPIWTDSLLHHPTGSASLANILCAVEMIDEAIPLLQFTKQLAEELPANVRLIHAVPEFREARNSRYFSDLHRDLTESARVEIGKMQEAAGTNFPLIVSDKEIPGAIAEAATGCGADLVVLGRGKAQKRLGRFRTHTCEIIREAPCPVLSYAVHPHPQKLSATEILGGEVLASAHKA